MKATTIGVLLGIFVVYPVLQGQTEEPWEEHYHDEYYWEEGDDPDNPLAVTDGNPNSTTSQAAGTTAETAAFIQPMAVSEEFEETSVAGPEDTAEDEASESGDTLGSGTVGTGTSQLDVDLGIGSYEINGVDVDFYMLQIPYSRKLSDRGTLKVNVPVSITDIRDIISNFDAAGNLTLGDARVYGGGLNLGYAHKVFMKSDGKPYRWKVTPSAGIFMRESSDLNQGAWVYNVGLSSSWARRVTGNWIVNVGNSISLSWNSGRKDYPDPIRDEQQVMINGVQLFYLAGRWTYYGYVMDTRFFQDAALNNFQSYAGGAGFKLTRNRTLRATLIYEDGDGFDSLRVTVGTSWKF